MIFSRNGVSEVVLVEHWEIPVVFAEVVFVGEVVLVEVVLVEVVLVEVVFVGSERCDVGAGDRDRENKCLRLRADAPVGDCPIDVTERARRRPIAQSRVAFKGIKARRLCRVLIVVGITNNFPPFSLTFSVFVFCFLDFLSSHIYKSTTDAKKKVTLPPQYPSVATDSKQLLVLPLVSFPLSPSYDLAPPPPPPHHPNASRLLHNDDLLVLRPPPHNPAGFLSQQQRPPHDDTGKKVDGKDVVRWGWNAFVVVNDDDSRYDL